MKLSATIITLFFFSSCQLTYQNITGTYVLENAPKTRLLINDDSTFKFIKINQDPYLYTQDHRDQRFYFTTGYFRINGRNLFLTSSQDSLYSNLVKTNFNTTNKEYSQFQFQDIYNDSVGAGYIVLPDSSTIISGFDNKKDIYHYSEDMTKTKSLEFVFYGYGHWKYIAKDNLNHDINVQLIPVFRPNIFKQTSFRVRGKMLVQNINGKRFKFKRTKSGM